MLRLPSHSAPMGDKLLAAAWIMIVVGVLGVLAWSACLLFLPLL